MKIGNAVKASVSLWLGGISIVVAILAGLYDPWTASVGGIGLLCASGIIYWAWWVTDQLLTIRGTINRIPRSPSATGSPVAHRLPVAIPYVPRFEAFDAPVLVNRRRNKEKVSAEFLNWHSFTFLFWVDIPQSFYWSDHNRYLFAQTSDLDDAHGHPNAFYMGVKEQRCRLILKGSDVSNVTEFSFPGDVQGSRLISIRWSKHTRLFEFDIDAGDTFSEQRVIDDHFWPKPNLNDQLHFGGWFDNWDGGLSLLQFFRFRIFFERLSKPELQHLYKAERSDVSARFAAEQPTTTRLACLSASTSP